MQQPAPNVVAVTILPVDTAPRTCVCARPHSEWNAPPALGATGPVPSSAALTSCVLVRKPS